MVKRMKEPELERGEGEDQGVVGEGANRQWPPTSWAKPRIAQPCSKTLNSSSVLDISSIFDISNIVWMTISNVSIFLM